MKREQWNNQLNLTTEAKWENQCVNKNNSGQKKNKWEYWFIYCLLCKSQFKISVSGYTFKTMCNFGHWWN